MSYKISFYTLGCRVNQYESDAMAETFEALGCKIVPFGEKCDLTIINTCSVTAESDRKSMQAVRRAAKFSPDSKIIVAGCSSQISAACAEDIKEVCLITGNTEKDRIPEKAMRILEKGETLQKNAVMPLDKVSIDSFCLKRARRARAYVKIEDGCENKCAYCIIPRARGKVRSKNESDVISEVRELAGSCPEIILTGIETASYGRDLGKRNALGELLEKADAIKGVERLTVGSLDPNVLTDEFLEKISRLKSFLPHLHISLQSGCTSVLNRMRRKYTAEKAFSRIERTREFIPGIFFSADVIVGFPGETDAEFEETVNFFKKARFFHLHIFPYSKRDGTEAAEMKDQVDERTKKERCALLAAVQAEIKKDILREYSNARRNGGCTVLFEQMKDGTAIGHSRHYAEVRVPSETDLSNMMIDTALTGTDGDVCFGKIQ